MSKLDKKGYKNLFKIMAAAAMVITIMFSGITAYATPEYKPDAHSSDPIGGTYAYGHTGYSSAVASGYTSHGIVSAKTVAVYGIYRNGSEILATSTAYNGTGNTIDAIVSVSVPGGVTNKRYFIGSHADHYVNYSGTTWTDYTAIGEMVY